MHTTQGDANLSTRIVARCARKRAGFTLVELLTASVVMGFTLLGVYAVLQQALAVEQNLTTDWRDTGSAEQVADHLASAIERIVVLPNTPPLHADAVVDGEGRELICTVLTDEGAVEWRRYVWGQGDENAGRVLLQRRVFGGGRELSPGDEAEQLSAAQQWARFEAVVIAEGVADLSIQARKAGDEKGKWRNKWNGLEDAMVVRVRLRVGDRTIDRRALVRVTLPVNGAETGGG